MYQLLSPGTVKGVIKILLLSRVQNNENSFHGASGDLTGERQRERDRERQRERAKGVIPPDQIENLKCGFNFPEIVNIFQFTEHILIC